MKIFTSKKIDELCKKFKRNRKQFNEFMRGQTCVLQGFYKYDVERFFGKNLENEGWIEL